MKSKIFLLHCIVLFASLQLLAQVPSNVMSKNDKTDVVIKLVAVLNSNYVLEEKAAAMEVYLKKRLKEGAYDKITDPIEFSRLLNADLHSVYDDKHLYINYASGTKEAPHRLEILDLERIQNYGMKKAEILNGNIGYLNISRFFNVNDNSTETIKSAFTFLKNTDALIVDLRNNSGGSPEMVSAICSYLFKEKVHLNDLYERNTNITKEFWTTPNELSFVFNDKPVYVLVSKRTFSGAEEFSYNLQTQKRGVIIGETTGGGAHPVGPVAIANGFSGNIPYAKAINPITKTNWETIGVIPDIAVDSDKALDMALMTYYQHLIDTSKDENVVKRMLWSKDILNAKMNPLAIEASILQSYTGNYGERLVAFENGNLFFTGKDGKKSLLVALSQNVFKTETNDAMKLEFLNTTTGQSVNFIFDDGYVANYKKIIK